MHQYYVMVNLDYHSNYRTVEVISANIFYSALVLYPVTLYYIVNTINELEVVVYIHEFAFSEFL